MQVGFTLWPLPSDFRDSLRNVYKDVWPSICRSKEAVAFGTTEAFADSFIDGTFRGPHSSAKREGYK